MVRFWGTAKGLKITVEKSLNEVGGSGICVDVGFIPFVFIITVKDLCMANFLSGCGKKSH